MLEAHDVGSVWETLATSHGPSKQKVDVSPVGVELTAGAVFAGIDFIGDRHLLFPLREGEAFVPDLKRANVRMVRMQLNNVQYASVVCCLRELDEIFTQFCRELLGSLATSDSPARAARDGLDKWRRLFADPGSEALSEQAQIGLFGELNVLYRILSLTETSDVSLWTGPDGSQHDFRGIKLSCEVKATLSREGRRVRISSLEQLNPSAGTELYLLHMRLELHPAGSTLPELLSRVRRLAESKGLEEKLRKVGYRDVDSDEYASRYAVIESRTYSVDSDFPRIVPSSFVNGSAPTGVESLQYVIQLSNEPPFPLSDEEASNVLKRLVA